MNPTTVSSSLLDPLISSQNTGHAASSIPESIGRARSNPRTCCHTKPASSTHIGSIRPQSQSTGPLLFFCHVICESVAASCFNRFAMGGAAWGSALISDAPSDPSTRNPALGWAPLHGASQGDEHTHPGSQGPEGPGSTGRAQSLTWGHTTQMTHLPQHMCGAMSLPGC